MMDSHRVKWPAPLLQLKRDEGCISCSVAYLCHCLGYPNVSHELVQEFRSKHHMWEGVFPSVQYDIKVEQYRDHSDEAEQRRFWLGPETRTWVEAHLEQGQIGLVIVERVIGEAHALVVLESKGDEGVLVMDPLYGHRVDSWEWFLAIGAGNHHCHHIDGWYQLK